MGNRKNISISEVLEKVMTVRNEQTTTSLYIKEIECSLDITHFTSTMGF